MMSKKGFLLYQIIGFCNIKMEFLIATNRFFDRVKSLFLNVVSKNEKNLVCIAHFIIPGVPDKLAPFFYGLDGKVFNCLCDFRTRAVICNGL